MSQAIAFLTSSLCGLVALFTLSGCGDSGGSGGAGGAGMGGAGMGGAGGMGGGGDMSGANDMSGGTGGAGGTSSPMLMNLPNCTDSGVMASDVYTIAGVHCAGSMCHSTSTMKGALGFGDAASFKAAMVGVASSQNANMKRVTAGNINQSYLLYKLGNQQLAVGGSGVSMPVEQPFTSADYCKFITWVKEGAR